MAGWQSDDTKSEGAEPVSTGGGQDAEPVRTDGGQTDDEAVADIKEMLETGDGDGDLGEAVEAEPADDETSPAMDFGMKIGVPFAIVAVGLLFVGPQPLLEFDMSGKYIIETVDQGGPGNIVYISGATLALAFVLGVFYPLFVNDPVDDFKMDLGLGLVVPTLGLMAVLVLVFLFWPALYEFMNGAIVDALISIVIAVVLIAIAVAGNLISLVIAAIATLYVVGPALIGSYLGGFIGGAMAT